jgi:hypothetical protein
MSGVIIGAIKITLKHSVGIFVITGKNKEDILDKAFVELKLKLEQEENESVQVEKTQGILSPYLFA